MKKAKVEDFGYYIVFKDSHGLFVTAYGYKEKPAILEMKYAIDALTNDPELIELIDNFKNVVDYIGFDVHTCKEFTTYMDTQQDNTNKLTAKVDKKVKKVKNIKKAKKKSKKKG